MNVNDLTTLASCKSYLGFTNSNSDAALAKLITSESKTFLSLTNRSTFAPTTKNVILDGTGTDILMITDFPLIDVSSLNIDGVAIPRAPLTPPPAGVGYYFDADGRITVVGGAFVSVGGISGTGWGGSGGFWFTRARKNVFITYTFGFPAIPVNLELHTIPASPGPYTIAVNQPWLSDAGVQFFSGGTALTQVFVMPTVSGTYYVDPNTGLYYFAAADQGIAVQISYTILGVPEDVQQCVNAMVGYVYGQRGSLGIQSEAISGAASVNRTQDYPKFIMQTIYYYRRRFRGTS